MVPKAFQIVHLFYRYESRLKNMYPKEKIGVSSFGVLLRTTKLPTHPQRKRIRENERWPSKMHDEGKGKMLRSGRSKKRRKKESDDQQQGKTGFSLFLSTKVMSFWEGYKKQRTVED